MDLKLTHCFITVHDLDEALGIYRDLLGLEVRTDVEMGSMRWLTVVGAGRSGAVEISLETPDGRPGDVDALRRVISDGSLTAAIFETADCDGTFEQLLTLTPAHRSCRNQLTSPTEFVIARFGTRPGTWSASRNPWPREPPSPVRRRTVRDRLGKRRSCAGSGNARRVAVHPRFGEALAY